MAKKKIDAHQRVVVTGIGVIAPVGLDPKQFWESVSNGISGLRKVQSLDTTGYGSNYGGEVQGFNFDSVKDLEPPSTDRAISFALAAGRQAIQLSGLSLEEVEHNRFGVILGTCMGGMRQGEEWHRQLLTKGHAETDHNLLLAYQFYAPTDAVSAAFKLYGPKTTISTACAAGANAIGYAADMIRFNRADYMLAGGTEELAYMAYGGFSSLQSLAEKPCRPYANHRSGLTLGEGAGIVVLERLDKALARGAKIYAEIMGYGLSIDGYHPTAPHPEGKGAARAVRMALNESGLEPSAVQYINGHGTGTPKNDIAETNAIKAAFGEQAYQIPVSSTKSMLGHSLGAAGAIEGITTILAVENQFVPPTASYDEADPELDLDYVPNKGRPAKIDTAISNSFAFGGNNCVVAYGRYTGQPKYGPDTEFKRVVVTGIGMISSAGLGKEAFWEAISTGQSCIRPITSFDASAYSCQVAGDIPAFDAKQFLSPKDMRRMDLSTKYALITSKLALQDAKLEVTDENRERVGIIAGTGNGPAEAATQFHRPLIEEGPAGANPAIFPNTVFNAAPGQVAIHLQLNGVTSTLTAERASSAHALAYAFDLLRRGLNDAVLCPAMEEFHEVNLAGVTGLKLASETPRPFDSQRNGYTPSGGAITLVLETLDSAQARGAHIYGEILSYGMSSDGVPTGGHDISGVQVGRAIQNALDEAGIQPQELDYICASANGDRASDLSEARGISAALGDYATKVPVSTIKATLGEPFAVAGAFNVAAGLLAFHHDVLPPTLGLEQAAPGCKLNHVTGAAQPAHINTFLANSVACGGNNVSLLLRRYE